MKKFITLFISTLSLLSCSNESKDNINSKKIQKVVFYKNSSNARHWNFTNDLLKNITLADGTLAEEFIYDNKNRVVSNIIYTNGVATETNIITYNTDNTIKSINGLDYAFDTTTQTYTYSYSGTFTITCQVNSDKLAVNYTRTGSNAGEYHLVYTNGNMISFEKSTNGTTDLLKNFHFDGTYGNNPIADAVLPVARIKSLTDPSFFIDNHTSKEMPNGFDKGITSPYYFNYGLIPGTALSQIGIEVLDSNNNFVDFYSFADYYYQ